MTQKEVDILSGAMLNMFRKFKPEIEKAEPTLSHGSK
jgi:hypothetical protein